MISCYILITVLCLYKIKVKKNDFFENFLDREQTNSIKGVFILLVFIRHALGYIYKVNYTFEFYGDFVVKIINNSLAQLIVVMFLFYSGYGCYESFKKGGERYVAQMPKNRILTTLLNFDIAVLCFLVLDLILDIPIHFIQVLLSFIAWDDLGNSNWYIFVILICYLVTYIVLKIGKGWMWAMFFLSFVGIMLYFVEKPEYWYNTLLAYPAGLFFSKKRGEIISFAQRYYFSATMLVTLLFLALYSILFYFRLMGLIFNIVSILFAFIVVLLTMKIRISNGLLCWCGVNLFPLYIYQRIPMLYFYTVHIEFINRNPALFTFISFLLTIFIAWLYKFWRVKL